MSSVRQPRLQQYRRDLEDARGQGVFFFSPSATVSTSQAAQMLGISMDTVRELCDSGDVKSYPVRPGVKGSPLRIVKESIYRYMARVIEDNALNEPASPGRQVAKVERRLRD